jgi:hypothetical protein
MEKRAKQKSIEGLWKRFVEVVADDLEKLRMMI